MNQIEDAIGEKETSLSRMESLTNEYNVAKEKYKTVQKESLQVEKLLQEGSLKLEESDMKLNLQKNELVVLK